MTVTSSAVPPARLAAARALAGVLLTLLVLVGLVAAPAAGAATTSDAGSLRLALSPLGDGVIPNGQQIGVTVSVVTARSQAAPSGSVTVSASRTPLGSRAAVTDWLAGGSAEGLIDIGTEAVPAVSAGDERTLAVTVDPQAVGLDALGPGVYPLAARYESGGSTRTATSVFVVPGATPAAVGVIVPITAGPQERGLLTAEQLQQLTATGGDLRAQLDAVTGTAAILAVDPAIPAAIRVLGSSAPLSAVQWLGDLLALPNARFPLQFGDADLAVQLAAGLGAPLSVTTLAPEMAPEHFAAVAPTARPEPSASPTATATPDPSASPTPDPSAPVFPTLQALLDVGATRTDLLWPATGTAGAQTVAALTAGVGNAPITLVASSAVTEGSGPWAVSGTDRVLVYDTEVSTALRAVSVADTPVERAAAVAAAKAYATIASAESPGATLLVTLDRAAERPAEALTEAVGTALTLPGRTAVGLDVLTSGVPAAVTLAEIGGDPERAGILSALLDDETALGAFATILEDPAVLTAPERTAILQLIGNGWRDEPADHDEAVAAHRAGTLETFDAVAIVPPSDITLLTSSAPLGFSVRNELRWPVSLALITTPEDPRLVVQTTTPVTAGASQNTRVEVPVRSRVGSGESTLELQLRSASMVAIGATVTTDITVRAEWESVGVIAVALVVTVMIALGVVRTVRRIRARRAGSAPDAEGADG